MLLASPASFGIDPDALHKISQKIQEQVYPNIHSLLIAKAGQLVFEAYFPGHDQNFGRDLGWTQHSEQSLHDLRSVTKSVVSALVGIALRLGHLQHLDQKISEFFPELAFPGAKATWTLRHFLTMCTGLKWNEHMPYDDPKNDEVQMTYHPVPFRYVLERPLIAKPGQTFNYNGGATQVLADIVERASQQPLEIFAQRQLFKPLGIQHYEWNRFSVWNPKSDRRNQVVAPSGLRLRARDLLTFGLLYRNRGHWQAVQILPPGWVEASFAPYVSFPSNVANRKDRYGYQFWIWDDQMQGRKVTIRSATGNGDQHIYWDLENDLIVITNAGNYNRWDLKNDSYALLKQEIYPVVG